VAFPTRHHRLLQGTINAQVGVTIPHGLRDGRNGTAIIPDVVEFEMGVSDFSTWANEQIGKFQADDATNIYLANFDVRQGQAHMYSVVARSFYSEDDVNF